MHNKQEISISIYIINKGWKLYAFSLYYCHDSISFCRNDRSIRLVTTEDVARIDLVLNIVKASIIAVGDEGLTLCLELIEVIDHLAAEECGAVFKGWLVDNHLSTLSLDTLHDALDGRLAEVVGV